MRLTIVAHDCGEQENSNHINKTEKQLLAASPCVVHMSTSLHDHVHRYDPFHQQPQSIVVDDDEQEKEAAVTVGCSTSTTTMGTSALLLTKKATKRNALIRLTTARTKQTDDDEDDDYWNISSTSSESDQEPEGHQVHDEKEDEDHTAPVEEFFSHSWFGSPINQSEIHHVVMEGKDGALSTITPPRILFPNKYQANVLAEKGVSDDDYDDNETISTITASDDDDDDYYDDEGADDDDHMDDVLAQVSDRGESIDDLVVFLVDYIDCVNFMGTPKTMPAKSNLTSTGSCWQDTKMPATTLPIKW